MPSRRDTAMRFLECFCSGDIEGLAPLLAEDLRLRGPLFQFDSRESYLTSLRQNPPERCEHRLLSVTEDAEAGLVSMFYEYENRLAHSRSASSSDSTTRRSPRLSSCSMPATCERTWTSSECCTRRFQRRTRMRSDYFFTQMSSGFSPLAFLEAVTTTELKTSFRTCFRALRSDWKDWRAEVEEYLDAGNSVVVLGYYAGTHTRTGRSMRAVFATSTTFRTGRSLGSGSSQTPMSWSRPRLLCRHHECDCQTSRA